MPGLPGQVRGGVCAATPRHATLFLPREKERCRRYLVSPSHPQSCLYSVALQTHRRKARARPDSNTLQRLLLVGEREPLGPAAHTSCSKPTLFSLSRSHQRAVLVPPPKQQILLTLSLLQFPHLLVLLHQPDSPASPLALTLLGTRYWAPRVACAHLYTSSRPP